MKYLFITCCLVITATAFNTSSKINKEMKQMSTEIIRYTVPAEKHADFEKAYAAAANSLKQSVYCLKYQVLHGEDEPNNYIVIIHWTSKEDHLNEFRKSSEFRAFFNFVKPFYNDIKEMKHYTQTETEWERK